MIVMAYLVIFKANSVVSGQNFGEMLTVADKGGRREVWTPSFLADIRAVDLMIFTE